MRARLPFLLALGCLLASAAPARAILVVTVNFDTAPDGSAIAAGTSLNSTYQAWGITLEKVGPGTSCGTSVRVYANADQPPGFGSVPNVVSTCAPPVSSDISENLLGAVHAMFAQGANLVSIDVRPDGPSDVAVLRAYDGADNLINTVTSAPGVTGTLSIGTPGPPIRGVRFSGNGSQFARFDNLKVYLIARLIDFDHDTNGAAIANGTTVNATYLPWGVGFTKDGGSVCGPDVYTNTFFDVSFGSSPGRVSVCAPPTAADFNEAFGMVHANFSDPYSSVCIEVRPDFAGEFAVLRAYDASDQLLAQAFSSPGVTGSLCVHAPAIRGVRFSGSGSHYCIFDDLSLGWANLAGVEPATGSMRLSLGAPFPNPARGEFSIWCTTEEGERAEVELLDVCGRRLEVHSVVGSTAPARVRFGAGSSLPPGIYLVRLRQGTRSVATRAALLR